MNPENQNEQGATGDSMTRFDSADLNPYETRADINVSRPTKTYGLSKFAGIMTIVGGIIYCPFGIPLVFTGIYMLQAIGYAEEHTRTGNPDAAVRSMQEFDRAGKAAAIFFMILGAFMVLLIGLYVFIFAIGFSSAAMDGWNN
ncbi:MAG: hypothetical protein KDK34_01675 [Leptospiraceae bacterium]|nr:hypothetical protein [Leptospiraceae bacterium]